MIAKLRIRRLTLSLVLLGISSAILAQVSNIQFKHITVKDGLSGNLVRCIAQDSSGFMWFATQDALNRYDGRTMKVYRQFDANALNLGEHTYQVLGTDRQGTLWMAAGNLYKYNRDDERFVSYEPNPDDPKKPQSWASCVLPDRDGKLWVGTGTGLDKFDPETDTFSRIDIGGMKPVNSIADDHAGNLWITIGFDGVMRIDKTTLQREFFPGGGHQHQIYADSTLVLAAGDRSVLHLYPAGGSKDQLDIGPRPLSICRDHFGRVWIGTMGGGLALFEPLTRSITQFRNNSSDARSLASSFIGGLCVDREGNLWISTANGVDRLTRWGARFVHVVHNTENPNSLVDGGIRAIMEDSRGNIWAGTWGNGLSRWDQTAGQFHNYTSGVFDPFVSVVYEDRSGNVWIGTNQSNGLMKWNQGSDTFSKDNLDPTLGSRNMVRAILEDSRGRFWVGTSSGVCLYDRMTKGKRWYTLDTTLGSNVGILYEDHAGRLWVTTRPSMGDKGSGLYEYDRSGDKFVLRHPGFVYSIHEDRQNRLWLGMSGGLWLHDRSQDSLLVILAEDAGLAGHVVYGILEDEQGSLAHHAGNLWLSTNEGLARFNPDTHELENFGTNVGYPSPGIPINDDTPKHAYNKRKNGGMLIGLGNGFVMFHPDSIRDNPSVPPIVLTDFKLLNEPVDISPDSPLKQSITQCRSITLAHDQNTFSFEFAALDYTLPTSNTYAHQLVGFDKEWVHTGTRNFAQYTNLPPGEYTFHVKGSNNDGLWNEQGASIEIIIMPPWWRTAWAYIGYGLAIVGVLYTIRRSEKHRDQLRHQAELEHTRAESLQEVDQLKSRFFANISHEFRTPLALIKGPLERMLAAEDDSGKKQHLSMMHRNADRLLRLVNQLLDLSKLESGAMKLQASRGNIVSFVKGIASSFESSAGLRSIKIAIETDADEIQAYFDRDKLEKVLTNLLSNAFKFTPNGGEVKTSVQRTPDPPRITITVSDTGIGIPAEELHRVFDRFYQVDSSQTREHEGSGIGLALTKELVELHHGSINVESEVGKGTEFTVSLLLGREHLKDDEVVGAEEIESEEVRQVPVMVTQASPLRAEEEKGTVDTSLPLVLIIEDNADVRVYMREYLAKSYQVIEAHDGAEGIGRAMETIPDIIISDVMMPKKDGFEVCKALKLDEKTSHIPIILLTAKAGTESKIEGLETGADDYLIKPFDAKELLVRVKNLIETRRKLRERFSAAKPLRPAEVAVTSVDDTFLQKAKAIVEAHIGEEDFGVEEFANEMRMSRSQLLRKLTALTGLSVRDFVRYIRLHRAMDLLRKKAGTVAEIGYSVGFGSPAYFSKCFHEQFGIVPSDVQNQT